MKNRRWLWVTAVVITLASAVYQRMSGPTYPVRGSVTLGGEAIALRLTRTHPGAGDQPVVLKVPDAAVTGHVAWRRYPTGGSRTFWNIHSMKHLTPAKISYLGLSHLKTQ